MAPAFLSRRSTTSKLAALLCGAASLALTPGPAFASDSASFETLRIAHAGGALGKRTYTNSYQALEANLERGFRYFEIDFVTTSDGHLVCLHDWKVNFKRTFGHAVKGPTTLDEFDRLVAENPRFTNCTLSGLADWMTAHPTAVIVTDVKGDNLAALASMAEALPDAGRRVIPQVYDPANYTAIKTLGFEQMIWSLYRFDGTGFDVIQWASNFEGRFAIAMPAAMAKSPLPNALAQRGIPSYTHTINRKADLDMYQREYGVAEIYTDHLAPDSNGSRP